MSGTTLGTDPPERPDDDDSAADPVAETQIPTVPRGGAPERPSNPLADTIPASSPPHHSSPPADAAKLGDRYRIGAELGRGGMGRVVEAFDTQLGRTVALKEVLPTSSATIVRRFQREVQITARLEHASIVPLYDSGKNSDGKPFYVMRRVTGRPLDQLLERAHGLDERLALLPNALAAIDAIAHAHRRGVIHRDLKPANILVGELGETVVIDWGLAKVIGEEEIPDSGEPMIPSAADSLKTQIGAVFGTPGFMAPEQARGEELDERGDVYALGATLYHLIAGKPPVAGKSATEMIASTMQHKIVPVTRIVPEAPPELVTIIDKALAADAAKRYANAGELAEDVRRFTTGQLVAAHNYTRWQHMARFARRHRAVLGVAAAASVAVAALSWVSVHRVLAERDEARSARAEAEMQRQNAEATSVQLRQRADDLTLAHVRSLVDTNPTEAIAQLKQLEGAPPAVVDEAKALAKAAIMRGVGHGLPSLPGFTVSFDMSSDGKRLFQLTREGQLQIIDLDLGRAIATRDVGPGTNAEWVDGGTRVLLLDDKEPPKLFDPATGSLDPIGTSVMRTWSITAKGDLVAYIDDKHDVGILDVKARTTTPLWTSGKAMNELEIARDGSFVAFGEWVDRKNARMVAIDRAGKILVEKPGRVVALASSAAGALAFSLYDEIDETHPLQAPAIAKLPLDTSDAHMVHELRYHGDTIQMVAYRELLLWNGKMLWRTSTIAETMYGAKDAARGVLVINADDNYIHLLIDGLHLPIPLTSRPDSIPRIAAVPTSTRIAATAGDAILVWDIADLVPTSLRQLSGQLVDEHHMLVMGGDSLDWHIWDVDTGGDQPIKIDPFGMSVGNDIADDGRLLALLDPMGAPGAQPSARNLLLVSADRKKTFHIANVTIARLVPGGVVFARSGGHVLGAPADSEQARDLVQLDGDARSMCATGPRGYAVLSSAGDLVKGTLDGAITTRTHIDIVRNSFLACDPAGTVYIAAGNHVLQWSGGKISQAAQFDPEPMGTIDQLAAYSTGLYVVLANKAQFFIAANGDHTPRPVPLTGVVSVADHGTLAAGLAAAGQAELVDLPSLAKWTLPKLVTGRSRVSLSPDGTRLLFDLGNASIWRLPQPGRDYGAWLDELTNAELVDGHVAWPWQLKKSP